MRSIEELQALSRLDPELGQLIENGLQLPPAWTKETDIHAVRAVFAQLAAADTPPSHIAEEDHQITMRDKAKIRVRVYRLRNTTSRPGEDVGRPGMMMLHGGGFCVGGLESGTRLCRFFAERLGGVAVNVEYRLAPEFAFPIPVSDTYDGLEWVARSVGDLGIDPAKGFLVAGESAGADLALAAAYLWVEEGNTPPLTGLYCAANSAASLDTVPEQYMSKFISMQECADAPVMSAEAAEFIKSIYKPDSHSPLAYPIGVSDLSVMPKTYFQACGLDPFRDCTLVMEQVWRDAGVPTRLDIYAGMPHVFWVLGLSVEQAKKHEMEAEKGFRWLLSRPGPLKRETHD
ncbi:Alpha/Beta hydrolase protein [Xylariaceae sp. FL1651]|nr:Alpha/Beta hydrolase protein [Xylariaceae sp. FL1651]